MKVKIRRVRAFTQPYMWLAKCRCLDSCIALSHESAIDWADDHMYERHNVDRSGARS